jgi:hypothetical protein
MEGFLVVQNFTQFCFWSPNYSTKVPSDLFYDEIRWTKFPFRHFKTEFDENTATSKIRAAILKFPAISTNNFQYISLSLHFYVEIGLKLLQIRQSEKIRTAILKISAILKNVFDIFSGKTIARRFQKAFICRN